MTQEPERLTELRRDHARLEAFLDQRCNGKPLDCPSRHKELERLLKAAESALQAEEKKPCDLHSRAVHEEIDDLRARLAERNRDYDAVCGAQAQNIADLLTQLTKERERAENLAYERNKTINDWISECNRANAAEKRVEELTAAAQKVWDAADTKDPKPFTVEWWNAWSGALLEMQSVMNKSRTTPLVPSPGEEKA